jgi:hypothetical protein
MNKVKFLFCVLTTLLAVACFNLSAFAQSSDDKGQIAGVSNSGAAVRFDVFGPHAAVTLTVLGPDGQTFSKEFKNGAAAEFKLTDEKGARLPDGSYTYELRVTPIFSPEVKDALKAAREKGNEGEVQRDLRKRGLIGTQPTVQSGSFLISNGAVILAGALEEGSSRRGASASLGQPRTFRPNTSAAMSGLRRHHPTVNPFFDFVIADDLIVQGSACVGLDCVDGENFGFDTIRVKENNTRIQYDDTSTSAGFPNNNWQIRANSSASGGGNFLAFVDQGATGNSETGTIVFEVDAGAPANSLRVSSGGNIGVGTATPVLDVHDNATDTPAIRLEQNNTGGFTAQTWDIAGNEANFFVRDVTSGSRLPFRIRPGAPTSSIDIAASGNVGIGTASPGRTLTVNSAANTVIQVVDATSGTATTDGFQVIQAGLNSFLENQEAGNLTLRTSATDRITITSTGNVGIGTAAPTDLLSVNGNASKPGGGSWSVFSDERLKNIKGPFISGLNAVMRLQPVRYEYKPDNALGLQSSGVHIGFGAKSVQQIIPEAVSRTESGYLVVNNDPIMWAMLNAIKEQQQEIEKLKTEVRQLRATRVTRRRR